MLLDGLSNIVCVVFHDLWDELFADHVVQDVDKLFFFDGETNDLLVWLVDELRDFVVEAREIADNNSVFDAFGIESIIEQSISNEDASLANEKNFMHFHELILDDPV